MTTSGLSISPLATHPASKKHILIVDDEAEIRNLLGEFLSYRGYEITVVPSAAEAQRTVEKTHPNLIIADLQLDESDGLQMIDQLKVKVPHTPVMLLTGTFFEPQIVREVLGKKVASYLHKPSPLARILTEVQALIG